jgi:flagella basal body P-ring formation protein FlgA
LALAQSENPSEPSTEDSPQVTLTLKPGPLHGVNKLYLSDITTCQGDIKICEEAYGVEIPLRGKAGQEQTLSAENVRDIAKLEWPSRRITVSGPKAIKVLPQSYLVSEANILKSLTELLKVSQEDGQFIVSIDKIQTPSNITLPDESTGLVFPDLTEANLKNPDWVRKNLNGNQRLKMTWLQSDPTVLKQPPNYSIVITFRLAEMVPVATRDIEKGDHIRADDVTLAPYEGGKNGRRIILETSSIIDRKAKMAIKIGQPFLSGSIENIRVISRGQSAQLIIRRQDLVVISKVQALDSGSFGDVIDALYPSTKKRLRVRIVDHSTVESIN